MANRITNREVAERVTRREPFQNSKGSCFAMHATVGGDDIYVVYSYGSHWPLYVYSALAGRWFENQNRYSVTTTRHASQARPHAETTLLPLVAIHKLANCGYTAIATARVKGEL